MIEYLPITVTPEMVVSANVFDDRDQVPLYSAGTTYAAGFSVRTSGGGVSVDGFNLVNVFVSKVGGNLGNTPPTGTGSNAYWGYESSFVDRKGTYSRFARGAKLYDPVTKLVYEVVAPGTIYNKPFVSGDVWIKEAKVKEFGYPEWVDYYFVDDAGYEKQYGADEFAGVTNADERATYLYKRVASGSGSYPPSFPANWTYQYRINSCVGLHDPSRDYPAGYRVSDSEKNVYLAAVASNNDPLDNLRPWVPIGPNNRAAMFDGKITVSTKANKKIEATIAIPNSTPCTTVAFFGCVADSITVTVRAGLGGTVVFTETKTMSELGDPLYPDLLRRKTIFQNLATPTDAHLTYSLTGAAGVELGYFAPGAAKNLGLAGYGASCSIVDLSAPEDNGFGELEFSQGSFKETLDVSCMLNKTFFNRVHNRFIQMRGKTHVIYAADDDGWSEALLLYGNYSDYKNVISYPTEALYNFSFVSLIS